MSRILEAFYFAKGVHANQVDKEGFPYILHLFMVSTILNEESEDIRIIALLHDVIEDGNVTEERLKTMFGSHVSTCVDLLTRRDEPYMSYISRIASHPDAVKVKIADLKHNLDPYRRKNITKSLVQRYKEALAYLEGLGKEQ